MKPNLPVLYLCLAVFICGPSSAADWPQWLGPTRNGVSGETGLLLAWPNEGPPLAWQRDLGEGYSGPVVAGERLILFHRVGGEEVVECLQAATGKERWRQGYRCDYRDRFFKGNGPRATPVIDGGFVYTLGAAGQLQCRELDTGKQVWNRSLDEYTPPPSFFGVGTSPLVEGKLLLVNVGGRGAGVVAFDKGTGKEVWRATNDEASYSSPVTATIGGVRHAFFFTREGLVSLDPASGAERFRKPWRARIRESVNAATPLVVDDLLFLSASYNTGAVLLRVGKDGAEPVWQGDDILSNHYTTSVHHGGHLYGFDGRQEEGARFRCVELRTGKVCWTQENFGCGSMVLAEGHLFVLTEGGELVLIEASPQAYREKGRAHLLGRASRAQPALANGQLYARDEKRLICLNVKK